MSMPAAHAEADLMTAQALGRVVIAGKSTELVRGRLVVRLPPSTWHGTIAGKLTYLIGAFVYPRKLSRYHPAPCRFWPVSFDVSVRPQRVRQPTRTEFRENNAIHSHGDGNVPAGCAHVTATAHRTLVFPSLPRLGSDHNSGRGLYEGRRNGVHDGRPQACKTEQGSRGLRGKRRVDLRPFHVQELRARPRKGSCRWRLHSVRGRPWRPAPIQGRRDCGTGSNGGPVRSRACCRLRNRYKSSGGYLASARVGISLS